ncbi:MAG: DUF928 domain-containing protein [Hormoscilla sp. GUM202]|nr:DUF928 domain-containing protein [Hormoscilla sp. GUM202]
MGTSKYKRSRGILTFLLSTAVAVAAGLPSQLLAESNPERVAVKFPKTEDRGATSVTVGGGSRGGNEACELAQNKMPLMALMPTSNPERVETTIDPNPTIYVYVPKITDEATTVEGEFLIAEEQGKIVYLAELELPGNNSGIYKLNIPKNAALEIGQDYLWQFAIYCNQADPEQDAFVEGWLRRMQLSPELNRKLEKAEPEQHAQIYADELIWHETLKLTEQLRRSEPGEWQELLISVEHLQEIASEPLLECSAQPSPNDAAVNDAEKLICGQS